MKHKLTIVVESESVNDADQVKSEITAAGVIFGDCIVRTAYGTATISKWETVGEEKPEPNTDDEVARWARNQEYLKRNL